MSKYFYALVAFCLSMMALPAILASPPLKYVAPVAAHVTVPLYGAAMAAEQGGGLEERLNRLEAKLVEMDKKLDALAKLLQEALEDKADPEPLPQPKPEDQKNSLMSAATKCATCHHVNVADEKGGGFRLFTPQGAFTVLGASKKKQLLQRLGTTDPGFVMPPPKFEPKLTPEERSALEVQFK